MKRNFGFIPYEGKEKYGFISYKSEDEKFVAGYAKALHDKGVNLWYDYGIPAGEDWYQTISRHIVGASFLLIFVTEKIFRSPVIQTEIQTAEAWGIPVVPVFAEPINLHGVPSEKATLFVQLRHKQGIDEVWKKSIDGTVNAIYELVAPLIISDSENSIKYRNDLLEKKNTVIPDVNQPALVQEALSEIAAEQGETPTQSAAAFRAVGTPTRSDNEGKAALAHTADRVAAVETAQRRGSKVVVIMAAMVMIMVGALGVYMFLHMQNGQNEETEGNTDFTYTIQGSNVTITGLLNQSLTDIVIPETIEGKRVTIIGYSAFANCTEIQTVVVPDSVTLIDNYAFLGCHSLKSITIPSSVTSMMSYTFQHCGDSYDDAASGSPYVLSLTPKETTTAATTATTTIATTTTTKTTTTTAGYTTTTTAKGKTTATTKKNTANAASSDTTDTSQYRLRPGDLETSITIYGQSGSYAQTYAQDYGISFVVA